MTADSIEAEYLESDYGPRVRSIECAEGGIGAPGDAIYQCQAVLRGSRTYPELEGARVERCLTRLGGSVGETPCDRLKPENGGKPSS